MFRFSKPCSSSSPSVTYFSRCFSIHPVVVVVFFFFVVIVSFNFQLHLDFTLSFSRDLWTKREANDDLLCDDLSQSMFVLFCSLTHINLLFSVLLLLLLFFLFALSPFLCLYTLLVLLCCVWFRTVHTHAFEIRPPSLPPFWLEILIVHVIVYFSAMNKDAGLFFVLW